MRVLVAGATGYVGGRLVPRLLAAGHEVRCLARNPAKLSLRPWRHRVEVVGGDARDPMAVKEAAAGCDAAYYLVQSTVAEPGSESDREAARTFRDAAQESGLERLVYLGMLGRSPERSRHMQRRREVGQILASGKTPVVEIRAAPILGSGSLLFEMLRGLTETLPIMVKPKWFNVPCQPVAVGDALDALVAALDGEPGRVIELGGPDTVTYRQLVDIYAREAGLRRRIFTSLPLGLPRFSAVWIGLVTPLPTSTARSMVAILRSRTVVADRMHGSEGRIPVGTAIRRALAQLPAGAISRWTDADTTAAMVAARDPAWGGTLFMDRQVVPTNSDDGHLFWAFSRIGGSTGYYGLDWAWRMRGLLDQLVGGVGLRRGRRHPTEIRPGDALDFWRVEEVVPGVSVRLRAEMRVPGDSWIEWEVRRTDHGSDLLQTAWFRPRGFLGRLYWYVMLPGHRIVFPRMARRIAAAAEERAFSS